MFRNAMVHTNIQMLMHIHTHRGKRTRSPLYQPYWLVNVFRRPVTKQQQQLQNHHNHRLCTFGPIFFFLLHPFSSVHVCAHLRIEYILPNECCCSIRKVFTTLLAFLKNIRNHFQAQFSTNRRTMQTFFLFQ